MTSQWAAVGAETDLLRRVRQLRMSWERLLAGSALGPELPPSATAGLRPTIVESWRRSLASGLDPTDLLAPIEVDESEVLARWFEHPLGSLTHVVTDQLRRLAEESQGIVVVTDASGLVLHRVGDEWLKERAAEMNLVEGARYDEAADGTNGIGTALAADRALQVFAFEHFNERHHQWICSCAPVHDPVSGRVVALVDLSSLWKTAHPRSLELVTTAARRIERCLLDARRDRDARLRRRYSDLMTRSTDRLVDGDGYVLEGAELAHASPFDIPEGGGEVVLGDGSVAVTVPLGRGEAYLLRQGTTRRGKSAPADKGLARMEQRARELATEQAALRQVATLVARESSPDQLFAIVAEQVAQIFDVPHVGLVRYEPDGSVVVGGYSEGDREPFAVGSRWPLNSPGVVATVRHTGRPARLEDYEDVPGEIAAVVRDADMRSAVATPIVVERHVWGAMVVLSPRHEPFPEGTEARLTDFTELIATAIANAEAREALARLADEQAALRRVATLVAQEVPQADVFGAIAEEIGGLLGTEEVRMLRFDSDGRAVVVGSLGRPDAFPLGSHLQLDGDSVAARVLRTRRPARFDDYGAAAGLLAETARSIGVRAVVGVPVWVEGRLWGAISAGSTHDGPLPSDTEARLDQFTQLMATAIANSEARTEVQRLVDEQAALRQVAILVAQQPSPSEVFTAVTEAVGLLLDADLAVLHVFPGDGTATTVASWGADSPMLPIGTRFPLDGDNLAARIVDNGAPAQMYSSDKAWERAATVLSQSLRVRSAVGAPILVEGKLWGALMAATRRVEPWAENAETRIAAFTELVATAIANAQSREALAELTEEQAALRRVATLVASRAQPDEVFRAVSDEVGRLFGTELAAVTRIEPDGRTVASWKFEKGNDLMGADRSYERRQLADFPASAEVRRTGRSARADTAGWESEVGEGAERMRSLGSSVASPIVVEGQLWGTMAVASTDALLPVDTEERLENFTELIATAIANAESREARAMLTEEQAAQRRVATLVAQGTSPQDLFAAVAEEVGRLLPAANVSIGRYEPDDSITSMASWSSDGPVFPPGVRWPIKGTNVAWMVLQTGRPARIDDFSAATDSIGVAVREAGYKSAIGSPIVVEGRLWGAISAASTEGPMPPGTEARLTSFTELVATAIANAESSAELAASRRRIVAASDDARRQIERDLHDGAQQQLVSLGLKLGAMRADPPTGVALKEQLAGVTEDVGSAFDALVEIARGIHPAILSQGGLAPALKALVRRSAVPVELHARIEGPLPDEVEVAAYYAAAEALTNMAKHARASVVHMDVTTDDGTLTLMVRDDGVGGADLGKGSGLVGLQDRVEALGGTITIDSSPGSGTCVLVTLPMATESDQEHENFLGPPQEHGSPTSSA
jgi:GAF domain-containing protein